MIQLNEIFLIGNQKCKVGHSDDTYWIKWLYEDGRRELDFFDRDIFFEKVFGHQSMYDIIENSGEDSILNSIPYKNKHHSDSPDFFNLVDLTTFVEELRYFIFLNHFHELILN